MRRGQGRKRPLSLCVALVLLEQQFPRRRRALTLFYRALWDQGAPQRSEQHPTWYRSVGRYIADGRKWMRTDPFWRQMIEQAQKPGLRAKWEPHPDELERYYRNAQMPMFDGTASRPVALSADYAALLKQVRLLQRAGQRFLKDLERERNR